jgi:hypothetical protein
MPIEKWRPILLAILAVALVGVVYVEWPHPADAVRAVSAAPKAAGGRTSSATNTLAAPDVHLKSLEEEHTKPGDVERDLFRFKTRPAPPPTTRPAVAIAPPAVVPSGPPPPPPLPPIALRFIGVLESANTRKIAVLSDGRGAPLYGKEGDTVLGQYKILHIGVESIEMAYLDGRGRQTIRLSGS